jgi:zinc transport system ATP-binding protein
VKKLPTGERPTVDLRAQEEPGWSGSDEAVLTCQRLLVGHGGRALLPPIDLTLRRGSVVAVVGRNGAGKSTFIKTLLGFLPAVGGRIVRPEPRPRAAYMAQAATLDTLVPVRAREVAAWGALSGWSFTRPARQKQLREAADAALAGAEASQLAGSFVRDLSEGQRARVLLARVLAARADIAFLDEPTAAMDAVAEQTTMKLLRIQSRQRGMAVVLITHLLGLVRTFADQVLYLDRDDQLALVSTPAEIFSHPVFRRQYGDIEDMDADSGRPPPGERR